MGYREDVAVAYTQEGWNQLLSCIKAMESEDEANIQKPEKPVCVQGFASL